MVGRRFSETTTKRLAYVTAAFFLAMLALSPVSRVFGILAGAFGFTAGLWMGRLVEAREAARGNGVALGE